MDNFVRRDGKSRVPHGVVDYAEGADDLHIEAEVQSKLDALFKEAQLDQVQAEYKLEVVFLGRKVNEAFPGMITAWKNMGQATGGGDAVVYFCPNLVEKNGARRTCSGPLDLRWVSKTAALCPRCKRAVSPKDLAGQVGGHLTLQGWAGLVMRMWLNLDGNCDIRRGLFESNIHSRTEDILKATGAQAGDRLDQARVDRKWAIYPLKNILKDTGAGADLQGRIRSFLST